jgi:hypothetical protein
MGSLFLINYLSRGAPECQPPVDEKVVWFM